MYRKPLCGAVQVFTFQQANHEFPIRSVQRPNLPWHSQFVTTTPALATATSCTQSYSQFVYNFSNRKQMSHILNLMLSPLIELLVRAGGEVEDVSPASAKICWYLSKVSTLRCLRYSLLIASIGSCTSRSTNVATQLQLNERENYCRSRLQANVRHSSTTVNNDNDTYKIQDICEAKHKNVGAKFCSFRNTDSFSSSVTVQEASFKNETVVILISSRYVRSELRAPINFSRQDLATLVLGNFLKLYSA